MTQHPLKVIILAAGWGKRADVPFPKVLLPLGEQKIIDYVVNNALRFVAAEDIYVVIGPEGQQVQAHLGGRYKYVLQPQPMGTGDAVRCTAPFLQDFEGDLLILYGDTPLFRPSPLRGLMSRHYLKGASLTLFTAVLPTPLPYGQIIRDAAGEIIDIIEEEDKVAETPISANAETPISANAETPVSANEKTAVSGSYEFNIGAYVVRAASLYPALAQLTRNNAKEEYLLTDCVRLLVKSGLRIANYQSYAEEDVLGINTPEDLQEAEFTLQKRLFRPRRGEEENLVHFGTGGWRAIIGEGFTMVNVRRLCQALANEVVRQNREDQGVVIGYDRRFLSDRAAETAAEVFAGNNIRVFLVPEDVPTPLITYMTADLQAAFGLVFTASHNPPEWNGLKVFHSDGSLLQTAETNRIEAETNGLTADDVVKIALDVAQAAGVVQFRDYTNQYVDAVEALIDLTAIRQAGLRVAIDPMFGVGQVTLGIILTEARCRLTTIHEHRNPLFGGRSPAPNVGALRQLMATVRDGRFDLGLAMDGDADRIAIIDEGGNYIHINDVLLLLYYYLVMVKGEAGGVVRNLATTHMLDRLAAHLGQTAYEVPVGFKHITAAMQKHNAVLGGESSGGLTIRGHIQGKDGIFASALVVEMLARTGKRISELLTAVYAITGQLFTVEEAVPATAEMKVIVPRRLQETAVAEIAGYPVVHASFLDGTKFLLENDQWLLLRFSGTEPVLRIFAEADSAEKAEALVAWGKEQLAI